MKTDSEGYAPLNALQIVRFMPLFGSAPLSPPLSEHQAAACAPPREQPIPQVPAARRATPVPEVEQDHDERASQNSVLKHALDGWVAGVGDPPETKEHSDPDTPHQLLARVSTGEFRLMWLWPWRFRRHRSLLSQPPWTSLVCRTLGISCRPRMKHDGPRSGPSAIHLVDCLLHALVRRPRQFQRP